MNFFEEPIGVLGENEKNEMFYEIDEYYTSSCILLKCDLIANFVCFFLSSATIFSEK